MQFFRNIVSEEESNSAQTIRSLPTNHRNVSNPIIPSNVHGKVVSQRQQDLELQSLALVSFKHILL